MWFIVQWYSLLVLSGIYARSTAIGVTRAFIFDITIHTLHIYSIFYSVTENTETKHFVFSFPLSYQHAHEIVTTVFNIHYGHYSHFNLLIDYPEISTNQRNSSHWRKEQSNCRSELDFQWVVVDINFISEDLWQRVQSSATVNTKQNNTTTTKPNIEIP